MDSKSLINVISGFDYKTIQLSDVKPGMSTLCSLSFGDNKNIDPITKIFFSRNTKSKKISTMLMLKWKKTKKITELVIHSKDITFGHYDFNLDTIQKNKYYDLGLCGEKAKIISRSFTVCDVSYIYTESGFFVVNNVLLHLPHNWLLSHTKYLGKLSTTAVGIENSLVGHYLI